MKRNKYGIIWEKAPDIKKKSLHIINILKMSWIDKNNLYFIRSQHSSARARARIWGLPKVWQMSLREKPAYIIEVISEKFDNLTDEDKNKVLIHELSHIPKNFSGSLLPHIRKKGKRNFYDRVNSFFNQLKIVNR